MFRTAVIDTRVVFTGVTELARECGYTQSYVSRLLARGYSPDDIRERAEVTAEKRVVRTAFKAALEQG
jgi:hypothetical protein